MPSVLATIESFWPGHPELFVATDGDFAGEQVLRHKGTSFTELLSKSVHSLREIRPKAKYLFLLLEDLCPLDHVDQAHLDRMLVLVQKHNVKSVVLPWANAFSHDPRSDWELSSEAEIVDENIKFVPISPDWRTVNSLVAGLWDIEHLAELVDNKISDGVHDPWGFEAPSSLDLPVHYLCEGAWPTVRDGFLVQGKINVRMLVKRKPPPSPILSIVYETYCGIDSHFLTTLKYRLTTQPPKTIRGIKKRLKRLAKSA